MPKKENDTSAIGKNTYFASLLAGFLLAIATPAQAATVKYTELNERLPYDELITIVGNLSDFERGTTKVQDIMDIQSITLLYRVEGLAEKSANVEITDERWQVVLEKLPEKSQVVFTFQITGRLSEKKTKKVIGQLTNDPEFKQKVQKFIDSSAGKEFAARAYYAEVFANAVVPILNRQLPGVELVENENLRWSLVGQTSFADFVPLRAALADSGYAGITEGLAPSEIYKRVCKEKKNANDMIPSNAFRFIENYETLKIALKQTILKNSLVKVNFSSVTETKDVTIYYDFDIAAIHLPGLDELRSFSTVNLYIVDTEATPDPLFSRSFWKRSSITVGLSLKAISGKAQSKIEGNKAFLVGLGFRINKYFRMTAGTSIYRVATEQDDGKGQMQNDDLKHTFYWGLSMDLSRLPLLPDLFGANTGTSSD